MVSRALIYTFRNVADIIDRFLTASHRGRSDALDDPPRYVRFKCLLRMFAYVELLMLFRKCAPLDCPPRGCVGGVSEAVAIGAATFRVDVKYLVGEVRKDLAKRIGKRRG
jgi:hypothetical protein